MTDRLIVVGVDGSPNAAAALQWATADSCRRGRDVVAALAWSFLDQVTPADHGGFDPSYSEKSARAALEAFAEAAVGAEGAARIDQRVVCGLAAEVLLDLAQDASLLVVGARGSGGFPLLRVGSTTTKVVERATVPVAVIRESSHPAERIVVGVDGSPTGADALHWAAREARARDWPLEVVHVWQRPFLSDHIYVEDAPIFDRLERAARDTLDEHLAAVDTAHLRVEQTVVAGSPAGCLLEAASDGALLVIGSRGTGALLGALLGSVARQIVEHATGPVVLVPEV